MSFGTIFVTQMTYRTLFLTEIKENSDQLDFETSSDFEDEIDDDIDLNTDLY